MRHGLRVRPGDFVYRGMSLRRASLPTLVSCLLIAAAPAAASADLPGDDLRGAFREKDMTWPGGVPRQTVTPDAAGRRYKRTVLILPRLSSRFGYRFHPIRQTMALHSGIDIPAPMGTPVAASAAGHVRFAGSAGGYGKMVEIDHGHGLSTRYAHLSRILVRPGGVVATGETIALMGSTGLSTGSHLHFEVRVNGRAADPIAYLTGGVRALDARPALAYRPARSEISAPHLSQFARARDAAAGVLPGDGSRATSNLP